MYIGGMLAGGYYFNLGIMKPQVLVNLGYSNSSVTSDRKYTLGNIYSADTKQNVMNLGLTLSNKFTFSEYAEEFKDMYVTAEAGKVNSLKPTFRVVMSF